VATVTVKVIDNGSTIAPSINFFQRTFTITVQPVNDPPVFISTPVKVAAINEPYNYLIEIKDEESESLPITASEKPSWATFTSLGGGKAKLSGVPPASATGSANIRLTVTDGGQTVEQQFILIVNTRPTITSFNVTTSEDVPVTFSATQFSSVYKDVNQHAMASIQITAMPVSGTLLLSAQEVKPNDTIPASSLNSLIYKPDLNYAGNDKFEWKASDGYHFSISASAVAINMLPVNDPPVITLETDSLNYEVNGEPAALTALFEINDPDNDSISNATLIFKKQNYQNQYDLLLFQNTSAIKGLFDYQTGTLSLSGKAPSKEYERAVKSIQYNHLNTVDPLLKLKTVSITVNDGKLASEEKDRLINPRYTFIELEIPTGFTPNGDNANDKWIITRPGGIEQLEDALIRVFNKRGVIVYQALGFDRPWDGTFNGEVLPADTYYFTIDLKLRSKKTYKGIVTILR
jgi:gliding motility-associated-like protein